MKYLASLFFVLLCLSCFLSYRLYGKITKVAFIDTAYIFENFKLKKELEVKFSEIKTFRQKQLDSLYNIIDQNKLTQKAEVMAALKEEYLAKRKKYSEEQENIKASYDNQIWTQLNSMVKEYSDEKGLDMVFGANGQGSIMHGKDDYNISREFMEFANQKYDGK